MGIYCQPHICVCRYISIKKNVNVYNLIGRKYNGIDVNEPS